MEYLEDTWGTLPINKNNAGTNKRVTYKGITASAAEVREVMQLNSIGALDGFEEAPEIGG